MKEKVNGEKVILDYLRTHPHGITQNEALLYFGVGRLSDVIFKLRRKGNIIKTEQFTVKTKLGGHANPARYILEEEA